MSDSESPCPIAAAVAEDIRARSVVGLAKYGVTLARQDLTETEWKIHLYEELLDAACYLKRLIEEEKKD